LQLAGEFGFKKSSNLAFVQTQFFQGFHKFAHQLLRVPHLFGPGAAATGCDERSQSVPNLEHALLLQLAIRLDYGVGIDHQGFGKSANARELISGSQGAGFHGVAHLLPVDAQLDLLQKGAAEIIRLSDLRERLEASRLSGKPLRVKAGFDPTAPDLHLGHTVSCASSSTFRTSATPVIFLIGDFTSLIGDPTGRSATRKPLTREEIQATPRPTPIRSSASSTADKTEIRFNSEWLGTLGFEGMIRLASKFTVSQMLERDEFHKRFQERTADRAPRDALPARQAYDSVALEADVELGGTDQKFNLLTGRALQRDYGQQPQIVLMTRILEASTACRRCRSRSAMRSASTTRRGRCTAN
jgi:hypothetical protein